MANEDVEREVAKRVAGYQDQLARAREEAEAARRDAATLRRELETRTRPPSQHDCPSQEAITAAMRSRDSAFEALLEVHERHQPRDARFCRCGKRLDECADQQLVTHYPTFRQWLADRE